VAIVTVGGIIGVAVGWAVTAVLGSLPLLGPLSPNQRVGRHPPAHLHVRGDHLDGVARRHWFDRRIASGDLSRAPGPHRGFAVRIAPHSVAGFEPPQFGVSLPVTE